MEEWGWGVGTGVAGVVPGAILIAWVGRCVVGASHREQDRIEVGSYLGMVSGDLLLPYLGREHHTTATWVSRLAGCRLVVHTRKDECCFGWLSKASWP
jgi:hypothetical protein